MALRDVQKLLTEAIVAAGTERVASALQDLVGGSVGDADTLTIVANAGVHDIPANYLRGEVYRASQGDWKATTQDALVGELTSILARLVVKLRSRHWKTIYLIPTGHPVLSVQIKAMVYRVLRVNTVDLYYKAGQYFDVNIDQRGVALSVDHDGERGEL